MRWAERLPGAQWDVTSMRTLKHPHTGSTMWCMPALWRAERKGAGRDPAARPGAQERLRDRQGAEEQRARILLRLQRWGDAEEAYR